MSQKNPYDMDHEEFEEYIDNYVPKTAKTVTDISKEKNRQSSVLVPSKRKKLTKQEWHKTPEAKKFYKQHLKSKGFKYDPDEEKIVSRAYGGYIKKYAKGGGVRKAR
jgi:hypothetical protein